jgi:hypothetical protein
MSGAILISTAYLAPIEYFARISMADKVLVEREENYLKQTYRNRCYILASGGPHILSVPVYTGKFPKIPVKEIRIDYSKRWQQVHSRALMASYGSAPYFQYYFEDIERIIKKNHNFLLDLNEELTESVISMLKISTRLEYTTDFEPALNKENDFRYTITPKKRSDYQVKIYTQVFDPGKTFIPNLSIIDLLFNMGPDSEFYL